MKKYSVSINRNQRLVYEVEAESKEDAITKAYGIYYPEKRWDQPEGVFDIQYAEPETDPEDDVEEL
jgi:hypothetical protein